METKITNPWRWQDARNYVQAVEIKGAESTLYVSGQTAISADGKSSNAEMETQLREAINNLEQVINEAGFDCKNIVRLGIYSTSLDELSACFDILKQWIEKHGMRQAMTVLEVNKLFETLTVELEATVVK